MITKSNALNKSGKWVTVGWISFSQLSQLDWVGLSTHRLHVLPQYLLYDVFFSPCSTGHGAIYSVTNSGVRVYHNDGHAR